MKIRVAHSNGSFKFSRPIRLDSRTWRYVEPIFQALQQAQHQIGRFRFYGYLAAVYRTDKEWKDLGISKRMARHLAEHLEIPRRRDTSPVRTLIDATFPALDPKQKSRWSRALEFVALTKTTPDNLPELFKNRSGIAGCARSAAKDKPKKNIDRDDWP
jgi:hypothetical protein